MSQRMGRCNCLQGRHHAVLACPANSETLPKPDTDVLFVQIAIVLEYMDGGSLGDVLQKASSAVWLLSDKDSQSVSQPVGLWPVTLFYTELCMQSR